MEKTTRTDAGGGDAEALDDVCRSAAHLAATTAAPLRRLAVRSGEVSVELEWPAAQPWAAERQEATPALYAHANVAIPAQAPAEREPHYVTAALVGTVYHCPEPGAKPFVERGDVVGPGQQIAILEAMKLMTPVEADCEGRIEDVLVADGAPVEYGTRLFAIAPLDP
jgi:acetyl-CoA carboxylase biotin carboxyl carrier protein